MFLVLRKKWYEDNATYDKYSRGKVYSSNHKYGSEIYTLVIPSSFQRWHGAKNQNILLLRRHPASSLIMEYH